MATEKLALIDYVDDIERLLERLDAREKFIVDKSTFEMQFNREIQIMESKLTAKQREFRDAVFQAYLKTHADISDKREFKRGEKITAEKLDRVRSGEKTETEEGFERGLRTLSPSERRELRAEVREFKEIGIVRNKVVRV